MNWEVDPARWPVAGSAMSGIRLERGGQLQMDAVAVIEGRDGDPEVGQVAHLAMWDPALVKALGGFFRCRPGRPCEADVVQTYPCGVEPIIGCSDGT